MLIFVINLVIGSSTPCFEHNVGGYTWTENIGWISFSCQNESATGEGVDYGVDMATTTGVLSGYAWSSNIGWISFNSEDLVGCPSGDCQALMSTNTYEVSGWAKALSASSTESGGWDGWIKLRD